MNSIKYIILLFVVIFVQLVLLDNILIFNKYSPIIYPILLTDYHLNINRNYYLFLAFFVGMFFDAFYNTFGLHALALLITTFVSWYLRKYIIQSKKDEFYYMNTKTLGFSGYFRYLVAIMFIFQTVLYIFSELSFKHLLSGLFQIIANIFLSVLFVLIVNFFIWKKNEAS